MAELSVWIAVGTMLGVYALMATERLHRTTATLLGVAVLLVVHFIVGAFYPEVRIWHVEETGSTGRAAVDMFHAVVEPIDLNVILLLFGMMVVVAVVAETRIFQWCAFAIYKLARGKPVRLLLLMCLFTAVSSAFIDNVTTMLLVTPVSIELALVMGVDPFVLLMPEVLASNIGGAATLVGDPPNILVGSYAGLTFVEFIVGLTPAVVVAIVIFFVYAKFRYGPELRKSTTRYDSVIGTLQEEYKVSSWRHVAIAVGVLAFVVLLFLLHGVLEMEVAVPALIGAGILMAVSKSDVGEILEEVEWPTLVFFMMLFVIVGAVEATGALDAVAGFVTDLAGGSTVLALILIIWVSAAASAVVDNIPFTATMLPVVGALVATDGAFAGNTGLWWALVLGADFGGNATLVGASANIVTAGMAERAGHRITFTEFMKHGIPVAIITCLAGTIVLLIQWGGT